MRQRFTFEFFMYHFGLIWAILDRKWSQIAHKGFTSIIGGGSPLWQSCHSPHFSIAVSDNVTATLLPRFGKLEPFQYCIFTVTQLVPRPRSPTRSQSCPQIHVRHTHPQGTGSCGPGRRGRCKPARMFNSPGLILSITAHGFYPGPGSIRGQLGR
jgi:hypothetical protein